MSESRAHPKPPHVPDAEELVKSNPHVDAAQVREAQELIGELRHEGVVGPTYRIDSPYDRRPMTKPRVQKTK
jgi:hypothetical protein